jgi:imidazolonepropionase
MNAPIETFDLLITDIGQLCTLPTQAGGPQRGRALGALGLLGDAAVAIRAGQIAAVGTRADVEAHIGARPVAQVVEAGGKLVTPGLIDPHTHLIWAGDRAEEFEMRIAGRTYLEIAASGGGINRTVRATRAAGLTDLIDSAKLRLDRMLRNGTTTVEVKTGYGLDLQTEIAMLNAIALLDAEHPVDLVPTFLPAHDIPPEYAHDPDAYVTLVVERMIPAAAAWKAENWPGALYCDVFCEKGVFTLDQTRRIFEMAERAGLTPRLHADEFVSLGGVGLAVQFGAASVDHLLVTTPEDAARLGASDTVAVLLPATPFGLGIPNTAPVHALLDANAAVALATDCNPGTAWCESMQFVMALAARALKLTPAQALAASTINAAFAAGVGDSVGSIEVGKQADLVIWDAPDYRHLSYRFGVNLAQTVIKRGRVV